MMPHVFIPPMIRTLTNDREMIEVDGTTVAEVIDNLNRQFPGTKERLCQNDSIRAGLSIVVGGSVSALGLLEHTEPDTEIHFLPALGGG